MRSPLYILIVLSLLMGPLSFAQEDMGSKTPTPTPTPPQAIEKAISNVRKEKKEVDREFLFHIDRTGRLGLGMTFLGPGLGFGQRLDYYVAGPFSIGLGTGAVLTDPEPSMFMISYSFYSVLRYHFWQYHQLSPYFTTYGGYISSSDFNDSVDYAVRWGWVKDLPRGVNQIFGAPGVGVQFMTLNGFSVSAEYQVMVSKSISGHWFGFGFQIFGEGSNFW